MSKSKLNNQLDEIHLSGIADFRTPVAIVRGFPIYPDKASFVVNFDCDGPKKFSSVGEATQAIRQYLWEQD